MTRIREEEDYYYHINGEIKIYINVRDRVCSTVKFVNSVARRQHLFYIAATPANVDSNFP